MVTLTEEAKNKVSELLSQETEDMALRVAVRPGGCSGFSYEMYFDTDKAEDDELPNWWKDKVSKAADYLNIARDYLATDSHTDAIHEDTEKEFPIWGIPPGKNSEELLYTKATSKRQASKIAKILTDKHKCKKVRIQTLDLAQDPSDIWDSEKLFK